MIKEFKNRNLKWVSKFYCTTLVSDSLQENFSLNGKGHISSNKFIAPELSKSTTPKAPTREWRMGKELSIISQVLPLMLKLILFKR
jgi:hypothetical protein